MTIISIRLSDALLHELDIQANACQMPRTEYIRRAIELMNQEVKNKEKKQRLMRASLKVRKESMRINAQFNRIEDDTED